MLKTLYGHHSPVVVVDVSRANENWPVTVTVTRDRTVCVWKVEENSHLAYRQGGDVGGAECVSSMRDGWFATGHDDGRLALWKEEKKRPHRLRTCRWCDKEHHVLRDAWL